MAVGEAFFLVPSPTQRQGVEDQELRRQHPCPLTPALRCFEASISLRRVLKLSQATAFRQRWLNTLISAPAMHLSCGSVGRSYSARI